MRAKGLTLQGQESPEREQVVKPPDQPLSTPKGKERAGSKPPEDAEPKPTPAEGAEAEQPRAEESQERKGEKALEEPGVSTSAVEEDQLELPQVEEAVGKGKEEESAQPDQERGEEPTGSDSEEEVDLFANIVF